MGVPLLLMYDGCWTGSALVRQDLEPAEEAGDWAGQGGVGEFPSDPSIPFWVGGGDTLAGGAVVDMLNSPSGARCLVEVVTTQKAQ